MYPKIALPRSWRPSPHFVQLRRARTPRPKAHRPGRVIDMASRNGCGGVVVGMVVLGLFGWWVSHDSAKTAKCEEARAKYLSASELTPELAEAHSKLEEEACGTSDAYQSAKKRRAEGLSAQFDRCRKNPASCSMCIDPT